MTIQIIRGLVAFWVCHNAIIFTDAVMSDAATTQAIRRDCAWLVASIVLLLGLACVQ